MQCVYSRNTCTCTLSLVHTYMYIILLACTCTHTHTHSTSMYMYMCSAPAGTVESYGTSSGSAIASLTELPCCPYQAAATSDQEHPVPAYQLGDFISVDMDANVSTSEQVREFYGQDSQCAESAYPHGHRGANFTDNPQPAMPSQTGGCCATPTNGTPPNNINPIVCPSPNYHPTRPNLLPGIHHQGPFPATTNETGRKNLSPYPSTGFLPPAQLYRRAMCRDPMPHSPMQASDVGNGVLNRDQACYIQPNQRRRNILQDHLHSQVLSPSGLPDVRTEGFPHSSKYSSIDVGVLIYCSEVGYEYRYASMCQIKKITCIVLGGY